LVWLKGLLGDTDFQQFWFDAVRGATKHVNSNSTIAEVTDVNSLTAFDSDGFTVGTTYGVNASTKNFVTWNWKAGTTTGIDTTGSTITPDGYSFNQTSGMSIIKYTGNNTSGALVPHGLGAVPGLIIVKELDINYWVVFHEAMGATKYLYLNETSAAGTNINKWNDTAPTSVLFSLGNSGEVNASGDDYIAYCFTGIQGYSKFGTYEGNGNANGTFVYTGFRPAFIMTKSIDSTSAWHIFDEKRLGYNPDNNELEADTYAAQGTSDMIDIVSNGFKCRQSYDPNVAETYIYVAFAQSPFVNSNGAPTNAR
jgi:hypothetical protein